MARLGCALLFFFSFLVGNAQDNKVFYGGFFPEMAISHSFTKTFSSTFKVESQHIQFDDRKEEGSRWQYAHYRTDLQGFIGYKHNPFWKFSIGYQYRVDGTGPDSHRAIQQVAYVHNSPRVRIGHRLRFDQTFSKGDEEPEYRVRYRLAVDIPLEGQTLDPHEFYFITSNEIIAATSGGDNEIENRLVGSLGYFFGKKAKVEGGLDWRIDKIIAPGLRNRLWLKFGAYLNI